MSCAQLLPSLLNGELAASAALLCQLTASPLCLCLCVCAGVVVFPVPGPRADVVERAVRGREGKVVDRKRELEGPALAPAHEQREEEPEPQLFGGWK